MRNEKVRKRKRRQQRSSEVNRRHQEAASTLQRNQGLHATAHKPDGDVRLRLSARSREWWPGQGREAVGEEAAELARALPQDPTRRKSC